MKFLAIAAILAAASTLALAPAASMIYAEAYPADGMKRAALDVCAAADPLFNRLSAAERAYCYERFLQPPPPADSPLPPRREQIVDRGFEAGLRGKSTLLGDAKPLC